MIQLPTPREAEPLTLYSDPVCALIVVSGHANGRRKRRLWGERSLLLFQLIGLLVWVRERLDRNPKGSR